MCESNVEIKRKREVTATMRERERERERVIHTNKQAELAGPIWTSTPKTSSIHALSSTNPNMMLDNRRRTPPLDVQGVSCVSRAPLCHCRGMRSITTCKPWQTTSASTNCRQNTCLLTFLCGADNVFSGCCFICCHFMKGNDVTCWLSNKLTFDLQLEKCPLNALECRRLLFCVLLFR